MSPEQLEALLRDHPLTLLYFSTPTCNVCKVLRPKVEILLNEMPPWHFEYINSEEAPAIAGQHLVFTVPTLLLMAEGREISRFSRHFGMHELERDIQRYADLFNS